MAVAINGTGSISGVPAGGMQDGAGPVLGTAQASTSGTSIDFTGIPSWVKRVTVMFNGVSTSGTNSLLVQIGTSSGIATTGYVSSGNACTQSNTTVGVNSTAGFPWFSNVATNANTGVLFVCNIASNTWVSSHSGMTNSSTVVFGGGNVTLSGTLDRVRITTVNGTDTFDAGSINIMYE